MLVPTHSIHPEYTSPEVVIGSGVPTTEAAPPVRPSTPLLLLVSVRLTEPAKLPTVEVSAAMLRLPVAVPLMLAASAVKPVAVTLVLVVVAATSSKS